MLYNLHDQENALELAFQVHKQAFRVHTVVHIARWSGLVPSRLCTPHRIRSARRHGHPQATPTHFTSPQLEVSYVSAFALADYVLLQARPPLQEFGCARITSNCGLLSYGCYGALRCVNKNIAVVFHNLGWPYVIELGGSSPELDLPDTGVYLPGPLVTAIRRQQRSPPSPLIDACMVHAERRRDTARSSRTGGSGMVTLWPVLRRGSSSSFPRTSMK